MRFLLAAILLACAGLAGAQQASDYQASVPVLDQTEATRDKAMRDALGAVLARVSGLGPNAPQLEPVLARASQLVQRFGFERDAESRLMFSAAFDPRAVDSSVRGIGLAVWGSQGGIVEDVDVEVTGLRNGRDYARVIGALRGVPGVKAVAVVEAEGARLRLRVRAEGGASRIAGAPSVARVMASNPTQQGMLGFVLGH